MKTYMFRITIIIALFLNAASSLAAERDAVVRIETKTGKCSGVCVSPDGYILTAEHCVHRMKGSEITVFFGKKAYTAKIVYDPLPFTRI